MYVTKCISLNNHSNYDRRNQPQLQITVSYDEHIKLIESGVILVLDGPDSLEEDTNSER